MWNPTNTPNLLRNDSGVYYARIVHLGRQHWKSLKTKIYTVAKTKLPKAEEEIRGKKVASGGEMTFENAASIYAAKVNAMRLAPRAKLFRLRFERTIRRTWPELFARDIRRVSEDHCKEWQTRFENGGSAYTNMRAKTARKGDSATTINGAIAYLRHVFAVGVERGLISRNPAAALERKPVGMKLIELPSKTQFAQLVAHVRQIQGRHVDGASDLIEGLAYSGLRIEEANALKWTDVSTETGRITVRGTKTEGSQRVVPITPAMADLLKRMKRSGEEVFPIKTALGCLAAGSKAVGVKKLTHHDLRHYFATCCIESGVDIPTVSRWLGHVDGGALAMKTYGHLEDHSLLLARWRP